MKNIKFLILSFVIMAGSLCAHAQGYVKVNESDMSNYKFALTILKPVRYDEPKSLSKFTKMDGTVVEKAPQSFVYVNEI